MDRKNKRRLAKFLFYGGLVLILLGVLFKLSNIVFTIEAYRIVLIIIGFLLMFWALFGMKDNEKKSKKQNKNPTIRKKK